MSLLIRRDLFERAKDFNIILDDVAITELSFSREYTAAVEAKQVGTQEPAPVLVLSTGTQYWYSRSTGTHTVLVLTQYWYSHSTGTHAVLVHTTGIHMKYWYTLLVPTQY